MYPTVVTAFFPIRSKFPSETYMGWASRFMRMSAPVVLYTPPHLVDIFRQLRSDHGPLTIIPMELEETDVWVLYADRWHKHHAMDHEAGYHTPELYAVWANKAFFVADAIRRNPYGSSHFYWCDVGAFRTANPHPDFPLTSRLAITGNRLLMNSVAHLQPEDLLRRADGIVGDFKHADRIVGGLWGGTQEACMRFCSAFEAQLLRYFHAGRFAGKDQSVYLSAILEDPTIAHILEPTTPPSVDRWFFQEAFLSDSSVPTRIDTSYPCGYAPTQPVVTVTLMGGLGNQMFQVATAFAYARQHGYRLMLGVNKEVADSRPTLYWDSVFHRFQHFLSASQEMQRLPVWSEKAATTYTPLPASNSGLCLRGYFQSPRYFAEVAPLLRDMFRPSASTLTRIRTRFNNLLAVRDRVVVVHACRGDYGPLPVTYYAAAMSEVQTRVQNPHYLLTSDDPLFWIEALPHVPALQEHTFDILAPTEISDVECLALLQQFRNFILANSTFSWWAAFLAGPEASVIAPAAWFGPTGPRQWEDIYVDGWQRM